MKAEFKALWIVPVVIGLALAGWCIFLVVRQLAYARVERLTNLHSGEFATIVQGVDAAGLSLAYLKVFQYAPPKAKLFVVYEDTRGDYRDGVYVYAELQSGRWQVVRTELVWAAYGSADGRTWPPYW